MFVEFLNGEKVTQRNFNLDIVFFSRSWWRRKMVCNWLIRFLMSHEINSESEGEVISKFVFWRSEYAGTSIWDLCSSSEESIPGSSREIRKSVERDNSVSDMWNSWIHKDSMYWTILPNYSWRTWRKNGFMEKVHGISWYLQFRACWMDS